ncbi:MAG: VanZ family protein [Alphaproteobacteria bacterium]|nr:VanZ family protein [Alphaproteobacteria bacterium]
MRIGLYGVAVAVLLYLTLAPSKALPQVNLWDKAEHAIAWAVLAGVGFALFPGRVWPVVAFALGFGILVEILQGALPFGRDMDWHDWIADAVGVAVATAVFLAMRRLRP